MQLRFSIYRFGVFLFLFMGLSSVFAQLDNECRVTTDMLKPLIVRFNPYFTEHRWLEYMKQEVAKMDDCRVLVISQDGCKRHHTAFSLYIKKECADNSQEYWIEEVTNMMRCVFWERKEFRSFQKEFEENFAEKLSISGFGTEFNFPIGTRNFICQVDIPKDKDPSVRIEMVEFVLEAKVVEIRTSNIKDDGWFQKTTK